MTATVTHKPAPLVHRGLILEAVLREANEVADVIGIESHGHLVAVKVETDLDLIALRERLFHVSEAQTGYAIGRWASVDLLDRNRTAHEITITIRVAS